MFLEDTRSSRRLTRVHFAKHIIQNNFFSFDKVISEQQERVRNSISYCSYVCWLFDETVCDREYPTASFQLDTNVGAFR